MGTRKVYEEKLRRVNLDYDPTMNPCLGSARCLSLLTPNSEKGEWTITSVLHDASLVVDVVVYLVDANDKERFAESKRELDALLSNEALGKRELDALLCTRLIFLMQFQKTR